MFSNTPIRYCPSCGQPVDYRIPLDDNRVRAICQCCQRIHYQNPKLVVGTLPVWNTQVLLCRRNIEPRKHLWTLPGGFMELGETSEQGAERETLEESGAQIELLGLYTVHNVVKVGQVHLFYRARMLSQKLNPGPETSEACLFEEPEIPWAELAFDTVRCTLSHFFADRHKGHFPVHCADIF